MTETEAFDIYQPDDVHQVTATKEEGSYLIYCEECGRLFRYGHKVFEVLVKGDQLANHSHTIIGKGMNLTMDVSIKMRTEDDDKLDQLLADVPIDL